MARTTLLFALLFCAFTGTAQTPLRDSLRREMAKEPDDRIRLELTNKLISQMVFGQPDSAFILLDKAMAEAKSIGATYEYNLLLLSRSKVHYGLSQLDSAILILEQAIEETGEKMDKILKTAMLRIVGQSYAAQGKYDKGIEVLREAVQLADANVGPIERMRAASFLGSLFSQMGQLDSAGHYLEKALEVIRSTDDVGREAEMLFNIAINYYRAGETTEGDSLAYESLRLMKITKDSSKIATIYIDMAVRQYFDGQFPMAVAKLMEALTYVENSDNYDQIFKILDYIGETYLAAEDYENAMLHFERAADSWAEVNGEENADIYFKRGRVLLLKKEYQKARDVFLKTIQLKKESDQMVSGNIIWNLGQVYESLGMIDSAYAQYQTSLAFALKTNVAILQAQSYVGLGNVYERQGRWPQAKEAFQNAFQAAMANKLLEQEMDASAGLYRVYKKQGQSGQALRFLEKSRTLRDSLFNEQNVKAMARMEANFEFEKEKQLLAYERERDNEQQQNIRNRLWLIVGGLVFLLLLGLLYFRSKQKAAQELRTLNEKLAAQKEKLEEMDQVKSRFFTNISHEFRTPLTVISGMADQIRNKPDAWAQKGAQMIKQNALSLLSLINQILELRKLESRSMKLKLVHGEIIQYMRYIVESFQSYADDKGVTLHILPSVSSLSMDYDADKMLRILTNLCSNAIKYTPEKGHVYISFDQVGEEQMDHLQIRVQDTGVGIPEDQLPHIFDRFYQVEYSQSPKADAHPSHGGGGTGIGLALTQELVELMQGTIHVQSELGKGSTFVVRLPIRQEAAVEAATNGSPQVEDALLPVSAIVEESTSSTANTSSAELPSLLVVEDNSDVVQYLLACLEDDYQLSVARDGQQGIDMAIEQVPDLIISDVMMPKKTGYELCALLKQDERTSHIPIVLLTAKADLESKISGLERGADAYLTKPFEQKELMVRLKKLWELRQKLQERFGAFDASLEAAKDSEKVDSPEEIFLRKLENVILTHMEDADFGGVQLCKAMALSRTQLYNKIKALTGRSTSIYLRSVRLRQAKHLLQDTDKNVTEVAYEVGFKDPSYFSRTFAEEFGVPPSKVREG